MMRCSRLLSGAQGGNERAQRPDEGTGGSGAAAAELGKVKGSGLRHMLCSEKGARAAEAGKHRLTRSLTLLPAAAELPREFSLSFSELWEVTLLVWQCEYAVRCLDCLRDSLTSEKQIVEFRRQVPSNQCRSIWRFQLFCQLCFEVLDEFWFCYYLHNGSEHLSSVRHFVSIPLST